MCQHVGAVFKNHLFGISPRLLLADRPAVPGIGEAGRRCPPGRGKADFHVTSGTLLPEAGHAPVTACFFPGGPGRGRCGTRSGGSIPVWLPASAGWGATHWEAAPVSSGQRSGW